MFQWNIVYNCMCWEDSINECVWECICFCCTVEWIVSISKGKCAWYPFCCQWSIDRLEIRAARILLDNDHYAMEKLKKRVLEYLAVRQLKNNLKGPILCFVGPPGVGKTSVGRSIAKTLGREFHRIALGGVCDQSDIRGHR